MNDTEKNSAKSNSGPVDPGHRGPIKTNGGGPSPEDALNVVADHRKAGKRQSAAPQLSRILLWGAVLCFVVFTVIYFLTYESKEVVPSTAENGILFHKIAPPAIPATFKVPAYSPPAPDHTPPATAKPTLEPMAAAPKVAPAAKVAAYVERDYPYVIHVASYRDLDLAKENAAEYSRGFKAFLVRTDLGAKGIWYRLHIGHFPDATAASDAIDKYFSKNAVVGHARFACLVGSYPSAEASDEVSQRLSGKDFLPYTILSHGAYHVLVGAHPNLPAAEALTRDLSDKGFPNTIIKR